MEYLFNFALVAQRIEQFPSKEEVVSSILTRGARFLNKLVGEILCGQ